MKYRVRVIHNHKSTTPSIINIKNTLDNLNSVTSDVQPLKPYFKHRNFFTKTIESIFLWLNILSEYFRSVLYPEKYILIIHKIIIAEPFNYFFGIVWAEKILSRHNLTIYNTIDADYANFPKNTRVLFNNTDMTICASEPILSKAENTNPNVSAIIIPPSVDTEFFTPDMEIPDRLSTDDFVIGWLGNAKVHEENLILLVDMLENLQSNDIRLRILQGGAELSQTLQNRLEDLNIPCEFIKFVQPDEVPVIINSFDVGLAPLCDTEFNQGRSEEKIREYMSCGVPVIGSAVGENKNLITPETGILVKNAQGWIDAIRNLQNQKLRRRMANNCRYRAKRHYSTDVISRKWLETFDELCKN
jgi:glycosyltransferase involved in cell wall biosynthesis